MELASRLAADFVVILHLGFIVFAVTGGLLALRWRWTSWVHVPAAAWGTFVEISAGPCPLTTLEDSLRAVTGGQRGSDFITVYLVPIIYPSGLTPSAHMALGVSLLVVNVGIYLVVWLRRSRTVMSLTG